MIRAVELPTPLIHAFIDALEAWNGLEHELFMIWQFLSPKRDFEAAWEEFSRMSTERQRKQTINLVKASFATQSPSVKMPTVFDQLPDLTKTRDRIVHGHWHKIHGDDPEFIRLYDARGESARPANDVEEKSMLGRSRFYEKQLREAETRFQAASRELHAIISALIGPRFSRDQL